MTKYLHSAPNIKKQRNKKQYIFARNKLIIK